MITPDELLRVLLGPILVAGAIAGVGRWRRWAWALPLAAGAGFLAGYALIGVPRLPPRDGTDWLFWMAIPATALGVIDAVLGRRWGWVLGAGAGVVAFVIVRPLSPHAVPSSELFGLAAALAAAGAVVCLAVRLSEPRVGSAATIAALCVTLGAAAVVVLSSNLRIVGVYGVAAAAALGTVAVLAAGVPRAGGSVAVVALPLLAGMLAGGRYYPDPGVSWTNFAVLLLAPCLLLAGAAVPGKRVWVRATGAVLAVMVAVAAVTVPTALSAKKAAEEVQPDPYSAYYGQ